MSQKPFITAADVADLIGFDSGTSFLAARDRLEHENSFPFPMPTSRRPLKWRRQLVEAWAESCGKSATDDRAAFAAANFDNVHLLEEARRV